MIELTETLEANVSIASNPIVDKICVQFKELSENTYRIEGRPIMRAKVLQEWNQYYPMQINRIPPADCLNDTRNLFSNGI